MKNSKGFLIVEGLISIMIVSLIVMIVEMTVRSHIRCTDAIEHQLTELEEEYEEAFVQ